MKLNNIKYFFVLCLIGSLLTSCDAIFEDELPKRDLAGENAIVDQRSAEGALLGVYSFLGLNDGIFDQSYITDNAVRSGVLIRPAGTYGSELSNFTVTNTTLENKPKWSAGYAIINAANTLLYFVNRLDDNKFTGTRKSEIIAEARFLRAFGHMFIMKYYAPFWDESHRLGVLIRDVPASLETNAKARSTMADSYKFIVDDLEFAMENAPDYVNSFKVSKGAAKAFLANLLMIRGGNGDYARALTLAQEVLDNGGFKREAKFEDIFKLDDLSKEIIFARHLADNFVAGADNTSASMKRVLGGSISPSTAFNTTFRTNDVRYAQTFDSVLYEPSNTTKKSLVWKKVWRKTGLCPMFYMRLGQVYLIKAEAMARTNASSKDVLTVLNILRKRSGNTLHDVEVTMDQAKLMQTIFNEYLFELAGENDTEWFVTIRFKNEGGARMISLYNTSYVDDKQLVFPIPDEEMKNNPKMEDNEKF